MKRKLIIHPFLFASIPIIFLYAQNFDKDPSLLGLSIILIGFSAAIIAVVLWLINCVIKDYNKSSLLITLSVIMFYLYGPFCDINIIRDLLDSNFYLTIYNVTIVMYKLIFILWAAIFLILSCIIFARRKPQYNSNSLLNSIAFIFIIISIVNIGMHIVNANEMNHYSDQSPSSFSIIDRNVSAKYPDIYYIILDGYANNRTLEDIYNYDNSEFEGYLKRIGFFVAEDSKSNYASTYLSISSSLNFEYINYLSENNRKSQTMQPLYMKIRDNKAMHFLKSKGYKIILIGSGWPGTEFSPQADINLNSGIKLGSPLQSDFLTVLLKMSILRPFLYNNQYLFLNDRERVLSSFEDLSETSRLNGPKFVFAHIVCPHPPFLFGKNGESTANSTGWGPKEPYIDQLIFINKKIETLIDELLGNQNKNLIIILQSDHGPSSTFVDWDPKKESELNETMLEEKFLILNAYYFPNNKSVPIYKSITPVNTFRLVFNYCFNEDYRLLEDINYFSWYDYPYNFVNITGSIKP